MKSIKHFIAGDAQYINLVDSELRQMHDKSKIKIEEEVAKARVAWNAIFWKHVDSIIERRLAHIDANLTSYSTQDQLKANEVASDLEPFVLYSDPQGLILSAEKSFKIRHDDLTFGIILRKRSQLLVKRYNAKRRSNPESDEALCKMVADHVTLRDRAVASWTKAREELYSQIFQEISEHNATVLQEFESVDLAELDLHCRGGKSLEAFCFDLEDTS